MLRYIRLQYTIFHEGYPTMLQTRFFCEGLCPPSGLWSFVLRRMAPQKASDHVFCEGCLGEFFWVARVSQFNV